MSTIKKLVKESLNTRNLIRRHHKKYQIPRLYEQCQNIQKILDGDEDIKDEFTIKDISHFFTGYHMLSKSIFKMNEKELEKSLKEYFYCNPKTQYYYFRVDFSYKFVKNSRIGNGKILYFLDLPKKVKERLEDGYSSENNRDYFANQTPENYKNLRSDDYYMKIKIISRGLDNSQQKAIKSFHFNQAIFEFFTLSYFYEESETSTVYISTDVKNNVGIQSFGSPNEKSTHSKEFLVKFIEKINKILEKKELDRNDIENKILLVVNMVGTNDVTPNVIVRFLFCIFAIETLLINNRDRGITHRLIERIAFLLGDDENWLNYYSTKILQKPRSNKTTKKYVARHLKNSRMELARKMYELYGKRSNISHETNSSITEQDYDLVKLLLLKLVIKMFELLEQGIQYIDNKKYPEKSIGYFINEQKYG